MSDLIIRGHNSSSYFWIMPVRVINYANDTNNIYNVKEYRDLEISIEEEDIWNLLFKFLIKNFDPKLKENLLRENVDITTYKTGDKSTFEWNLTYNYFNFDNIKSIINEIENKIELLKLDSYNSQYYNKETTIEFYNDFVNLMKNMMQESKKQNYHLISFMGP